AHQSPQLQSGEPRRRHPLSRASQAALALRVAPRPARKALRRAWRLFQGRGFAEADLSSGLPWLLAHRDEGLSQSGRDAERMRKAWDQGHTVEAPRLARLHETSRSDGYAGNHERASESQGAAESLRCWRDAGDAS